MPFPNHIDRVSSSGATPQDLLCRPCGTISETGLELNVDVGLQYLSAWLGGNGCVPIYHMMEDAATAEICRAQVWQWLRHGAVMEDGRTVDPGLVNGIVERTVEELRDKIPAQQLSDAQRLYEEMILSPEFPEFLTLRAYDYLD